MHEPVSRLRQTSIRIDHRRRFGQTIAEITSMRHHMAVPQRIIQHGIFPLLNSFFVELDENALAVILGSWNPRGPAIAIESDQSGAEIIDPVEIIDSGESDEGIDLLQLVDGKDPLHSQIGNGVMHLLHMYGQTALAIDMLGVWEIPDQVLPFGDQQIGGFPLFAGPLPFILVHFTLLSLKDDAVQLNFAFLL